MFKIINKLSFERLPFATYEPPATEDYVISKTKSLFSSLTDTLGLHYVLTILSLLELPVISANSIQSHCP